MSNEVEKNQAEKLQQLFEEINNRPLQEKENTEMKVEEEFIEVDVLNLPPRKRGSYETENEVILSFQTTVHPFFNRFYINHRFHRNVVSHHRRMIGILFVKNRKLVYK